MSRFRFWSLWVIAAELACISLLSLMGGLLP